MRERGCVGRQQLERLRCSRAGVDRIHAPMWAKSLGQLGEGKRTNYGTRKPVEEVERNR
jgi:hypothetical protein